MFNVLKKHKMRNLLVVGLLCATGIVPAHAQDTWKPWDATASLHLERGNLCSGAIVKFPDSKPTDKALLLTAGHCLPEGHLEPGKTVSNVSVNSSKNTVEIHKGKDEDNHMNPKRTGITKVVYGTMTDTDIAVLETESTYLSLSAAGIPAREIASDELSVGDVVSTPSPTLSNPFRGCTISGTGLNKKVSGWSWHNFVEVSGSACTALREGGSGAPIISESDGMIRGVVSMVFDGANREILGAGPQAAPLLSCINQGTYSADTCRLPRP